MLLDLVRPLPIPALFRPPTLSRFAVFESHRSTDIHHLSLRCRALWGVLEEDNNINNIIINNIMPILPAVSSPRLNTKRDNFFTDNTDHLLPAEDIIPTTSTATTVPTAP